MPIIAAGFGPRNNGSYGAVTPEKFNHRERQHHEREQSRLLPTSDLLRAIHGLVEKGLVEMGQRPDGQIVWRLTPKGKAARIVEVEDPQSH